MHKRSLVSENYIEIYHIFDFNFVVAANIFIRKSKHNYVSATIVIKFEENYHYEFYCGVYDKSNTDFNKDFSFKNKSMIS